MAEEKRSSFYMSPKVQRNTFGMLLIVVGILNLYGYLKPNTIETLHPMWTLVVLLVGVGMFISWRHTIIKVTKGKAWYPYVHPRYSLGARVYILKSIADKHPASPLAGEYVYVTWRKVYLINEDFGENPSEHIPVRDSNGETWFVEKEYVTGPY